MKTWIAAGCLAASFLTGLALSHGCSSRDAGCVTSSDCPTSMRCVDGECRPGAPLDAGTDAAVVDSGGDAAAPDAMPVDSAAPDSMPMDSAAPDAMVMDSATADSAAPDAGPTMHTIFVTSERMDGAFGGIAGADATCQRLAGAAGRTGTYRAVLSAMGVDARARLALSGPVYMVDGTLIAADPAELWGGSVRTEVDLDESGGAASYHLVWSGTDSDGTADSSGGFCSDWTSTSGGAETGRTDRSDGGWISIYGSGASGNACSNDGLLYCISVD